MREKYIFLFGLLFSLNNLYSVGCSKGNLIKCLDSVCAINVSSNPAARCQLCGSDTAGITNTNMQMLTLGTKSKYIISGKELKNAPEEAEARYAWAIQKCIRKNENCKEEDASENYDKLIEQSCVSAGLSEGFNKLTKEKEKSKHSCKKDINVCLTKEENCGTNYKNCFENEDLDKFISQCSVLVNNCDVYVQNIRDDILKTIENSKKNKKNLVASIIESYKNMRDAKKKEISESCQNDSMYNMCVESFCRNKMKKKCEAGFEKIIAGNFCNFYKVACGKL